MVVCAYSEGRWSDLVAAIDSLARQTLEPAEVLIVIDHNPALLGRARARWPEHAVMASAQSRGLSGARNTGLLAATGDLVAFIDDDARADPDWLRRLTAAYADPDVVAAGGAVAPAWDAGRPAWFPAEFDWVVGCTHSGHPPTPAVVRNLVGANMSFRREAIAATGGFEHTLGRVGTLPSGCEETELCIRLAQSKPGAVVLYVPAARVAHRVPAARANRSYFVSRCRAEGRSKALVAGLAGQDAALEAERSYVRVTLPRGVLRGLADFVRGDRAGLTRAAAIVGGLAATIEGYVAGTVRRMAS